MLQPASTITSGNVTTLTFVRPGADCAAPARAVVSATCVEEGMVGGEWFVSARAGEHAFPSRTTYGVLTTVTVPGAC